MIFVTVGTHEQPFDRLLEAIDKYAKEKQISKSQIVVQKGFSKRRLENVTAEEMFSIEQMNEFYEQAEIVITHGGPGSMFPAWILGKPIIAVPRQAEYNEHVDNHQVEFCDFMNEKGKIICVKDIVTLASTIDNIDFLLKKVSHQTKTQLFAKKLEENINLLLRN